MSSTLKESNIGGVCVGKGPGSASSNLRMGSGGLGSIGTLSTGNVAIGCGAGGAISNSTAYRCNTIIGAGAAQASNIQLQSVTIGALANSCGQNIRGVTIGYRAAFSSENLYSVIIGNHAGCCNTHNNSVVIGNFASRCSPSYQSVIIGYQAGCKYIGGNDWFRSVVIGTFAGQANAYPDPRRIVSIGKCTQSLAQGNVTIGDYARGGFGSVAIGHYASAQDEFQVAIGFNASVSGNYYSVWGNSGNNQNNCIWPEWTFLSDCRDKADVTPLTENYGIPLLKKLKPASFKWDNRETYVRELGMEFGQKDGSFVSEHTNYGFIAQDIKQSADELGIKIPGVENESEKYRLPYETFIFTSIESIKKMIDRIEILENELTLLENQ